MSIFVLIITLIHASASFYKPKYGLCTLIAIKVLIPDAARSVIPFLSLNSLCALILGLVVFFHILIRKIPKSAFNNRIVAFLLLFCTANFFWLLCTTTPISYQLTPMINYIVLQLFPAVAASIIITTKKDLILILKVFILSILICGAYATIAWSVGSYSYNDMFVSYFGYGRDADLTGEAESMVGGIIGRSVGTCSGDAYSYGMIAPILFLLAWIYHKKLHWNTTLLASIFLIISVLLTIRRSPIITCMTFFFCLFIFSPFKQKTKQIGIIIGIIVVGIIAIEFIPQLSNFKYILESSLFFWDESVSEKNEISGSSTSLREYQLFYALNQLRDNPLFGNGWGSMYYKSHPTMFGWESIIFTTLMQFGFLGAILWSYMFWTMYKYSTYKQKDTIFQKCFILAALVLCLFTDTIYPAFIFLGCVFLGKNYLLEENKPTQKEVTNENSICMYP